VGPGRAASTKKDRGAEYAPSCEVFFAEFHALWTPHTEEGRRKTATSPLAPSAG
jgi:hypothetical protein